MAKLAQVTINPATDEIVGAGRSESSVWGANTYAITEAELRAIKNQGRLFIEIGNGVHYWWQLANGSPVFQRDPRPTATWSTNSVKVDVGDTEPQVTLTQNNTNTEWLNLITNTGHVLRVRFVNGVATLYIGTDAPTTYSVDSCAALNIQGRLRVMVRSVNRLYPV